MLTRSTLQRLILWLFTALLVALLTGCSRSGPSPRPPQATRPTVTAAASPARPEATLTAIAGLLEAGTPAAGRPSAGPPAATPSPTARPTSTPFPDLSSLSRVDRYQKALQGMIYPALEHIYNRRLEAGLPYLDGAITAVPDHAYLYYLRANAQYQLGEQANNAAQAETYLSNARRDINQAIAIGPASGDYYFLRASIADRYRLLYGTGEPQAWRLELEKHPVLEDLQAARQQGNLTAEQPEWRALEIMVHLGYCQQAMDGLAQLQTAQPALAREASFYALAATTLACVGDPELALLHNYLAIQNDPANYAYRYTRAVLLTGMNRPQEALPILQQYLAAYPGYHGPRLFLRALIYYDLGDFNKARQDLEMGQTTAWGLDGVGTYVSGLLALQAGQTEAGNRLITQAASSLPVGEYMPLLRRVRREAGLPDEMIMPGSANIPAGLRQPPTPLPTPTPFTVIATTLAMKPPVTLTPKPSVTPAATVTPLATPTPVASITPAATVTPAASITPAATITPAPSLQPGTPLAQAAARTLAARLTQTAALSSPPASSTTRSQTPAAMPTNIPTSQPTASASFDPTYYTPSHELPAPYQGSGPFTLPPNGILELYLMPDPAVEFTQILSVTFHLVPTQPAGPQNRSSGLLLGLFLRSYYETRGQATWLEPVRWGANPFKGFNSFVDHLGGMHVILNNKTAHPITVQEFGVQVTIEQVNGGQVVLGFQP